MFTFCFCICLKCAGVVSNSENQFAVNSYGLKGESKKIINKTPDAKIAINPEYYNLKQLKVNPKYLPKRIAKRDINAHQDSNTLQMYNTKGYNPELDFLVNTSTFTNVHEATKFNDMLNKYLPRNFVLPISEIQEPDIRSKNIINLLRTMLILKLEIDDINKDTSELNSEIKLITRTFPNIERDNSVSLNKSFKQMKNKLKYHQIILKTKENLFVELENKINTLISN